jgi:hypothetical protein
MPIKILSETKTHLVFDERSAHLDEIFSAAKHKWPDALMDFIVVSNSNDHFALTVYLDSREEFRSDGQLTIHPRITLGQLIRATTAKPGEGYRDKVTLCWNNSTLHLKRPVRVSA